MDDEHALVFVEHAHIEVATTAATLDHAGNCVVGDFEDQLTLGFDLLLGFVRVRDVVELNLGGHDRRGRLSEEAAGHEGGRYGKGGDLLYRRGNPEAYDAARVASRTGRPYREVISLAEERARQVRGLAVRVGVSAFTNMPCAVR